MNKKLSIAIGVLAVASIGAGGAVYMAKSNLEARQAAVIKQVETLNKTLPTQLKFETVSSEQGLFESTGKYRLVYTDPTDKNYNGGIALEYKAEHDIQSWFGGDISFVVKGKSEGTFVKTLQIKTGNADGLSFQIDGKIKDNGSIIAQNNVPDFSFIVPKPTYEIPDPVQIQQAEQTEQATLPTAPVAQQATPIPNTGMLVHVKGMIGNMNIDAASGAISNIYKYSHIAAQDLEDPNDKIIASGINVSYASTLNNLEIGNFKLSAELISNGTEFVSAKGAQIIASIEQKNNKYDVKFGAKVNDLSVMTQKNSSVELAYSLNGIDSRMVGIYKKAAKALAAGGDLSEKDSKEAQAIILDSMKTGFSFNIDKIKFKNETTMIDFSGNYSILPTAEGKQFSFEAQSKLGAKVEAEGDYAVMANSLFGTFFELPPIEASPSQEVVPGNETQIPTPTKFKFSFDFENGKLTVNGTPIQSSASENIINGLKKIDQQFGIAQPEEVKVENAAVVDAQPATSTITGLPKFETTNK